MAQEQEAYWPKHPRDLNEWLKRLPSEDIAEGKPASKRGRVGLGLGRPVVKHVVALTLTQNEISFG